MAIVIHPTNNNQQIPEHCINPGASVPPQWEDHKECPDPLYCTTGRTHLGYQRALATTYEGALLHRAR